MTIIYGMILIALLSMAGCTGSHKDGDALAAHHVTERIKEDWAKVNRPLEIEVTGRTEEELVTIGSIAVWFEGMEHPQGDGRSVATEFVFDGKVFKPAVPVMADSTVHPYACYPYRQGLHPSDTLKVSPPLGPMLAGIVESTESSSDKILVKMQLKDISAMLRLKIQSDNMTDILQSIGMNGSFVFGEYQPFSGRWKEIRLSDKVVSVLTDCLLNNGSCHDFYMLPCEESRDMTVEIGVSGKKYRVSTTVPPMRDGSLTELRLHLVNGKLTVGSSWVDTCHPFGKPFRAQADSVKVGWFLQRDGSLASLPDSNSLALVVETDGRHGKAVGLNDNNAAAVFDAATFQTGHLFGTADGNYAEGCFCSKLMTDDREHFIAFSRQVTYSGKCALGCMEGCLLTQEIMRHCNDETRKAFWDAAGLPSAYIPSLFELARLAQYLIANPEYIPEKFTQPDGFYMSSCESGTEMFYSLDLKRCRITAYNSKSYSNANLRLFYLF